VTALLERFYLFLEVEGALVSSAPNGSAPGVSNCCIASILVFVLSCSICIRNGFNTNDVLQDLGEVHPTGSALDKGLL